MLRIALCDDNPAQCSLLCQMMKDFAQQRPQLAVKLSVFSSPWNSWWQRKKPPSTSACWML